MIKGYIKNFLNNKFVDYFLIFLIIFNIVCLGFETEKTIYLTYKTFFSKVELVSVIIFTIEYIMRLFTLDKLKNMFQPLMIIDLLAILPFYLPLSRLDLRIL
ncbi:ion transporter, partial [bacterium]|nr:ion transporter [bacterium]